MEEEQEEPENAEQRLSIMDRLLNEDHQNLPEATLISAWNAVLDLESFVIEGQPDETHQLVHVLLSAVSRQIDDHPDKQQAIARALIVCKILCKREENVMQILEFGLVPKLTWVAVEQSSQVNLKYLSTQCLATLAKHSSAHFALIASGFLEDCTFFLRIDDLPTNREEVGIVFNCIFFLCRIAGKQESGKGAEIIQQNIHVNSID